MRKIVFLGCENSHSKQFIQYINGDKKYSDIEILGCHSELDKPAEEKLATEFNLKRLSNFTDEVGNVDGVIVTARHGDYHLKFVGPYLKNGVTAYVDKPITISEDDAIELANLAKSNNVKLTGQSSLVLYKNIIELKKIINENGCRGGFVRAPITLDNPHGGFYFYCEHLVDMVLFLFGWYPNTVVAKEYEHGINVEFIYDKYSVTGYYGKDNWKYCAGVFHDNGTAFREIEITGGEECFKDHFDEFYETMKKDENNTDYKQFIAPVFVMNAIERSLKSKKEEKVRRYEI